MKHVRALRRGSQPNAFNFVGIFLKVYVSSTRAIEKGCEMHADIEGKGSLDDHISLGYVGHEQDWIERFLFFT